MDEDENPCLIYEADDGDDPLDTSDVPLVLTHDGGGTCFAYYCLNPLGRPTYEIHNPRFESGEPWPGGVPEMARHYVGLVRDAVPPGPLLLGGWSLGGVLSLEMARLLAGDPRHRVVGLVMVDSICPLLLRRSAAALEKLVAATFPGQFGPATRPETMERVRSCFAEARRAVAAYELPAWEEEDDGDGDSDDDRGRGGHRICVGSNGSAGSSCPPAILLRAKEAVPVGPDEVSFVDTSRDDRMLGWGGYRKNFFAEVVDIPGHHFSVFAFEHIDIISKRILEACKKLELLHAAHRSAPVSGCQ